MENGLKDYGVKTELPDLNSSARRVFERQDEAMLQGAPKPRGTHDSNPGYRRGHQQRDNSQRDAKRFGHANKTARDGWASTPPTKWPEAHQFSFGPGFPVSALAHPSKGAQEGRGSLCIRA